MGAGLKKRALSFGLLILLFFLVLNPQSVFSQISTKKVEGVVVKVSGNEVVVDIGKKSGAGDGMSVDFYRKIVVKHPVTGKKIEDRFFIGKDEIKQAGTFLSLIVVKAPFTHKPMVGDYVVLLKPVIVPLDWEEPEEKVKGEKAPGLSCPEVECPACECDEQAMLVHQVWLNTLGKSIEDRIGLWKNFITVYAYTPYAEAIMHHIWWLEGLKKAEFHVAESQQYYQISKLYHDRVKKIYQGLPLDIAVETVVPEKVSKMVLHYRRKGDKFYSSVKMERNGDFNFHYAVPEESAVPPGLEYFIEVVGTDGKKRSGVASSRSPFVTLIAKSPIKAIDKADRSKWSTSFEYVDFYTKDIHRDYFWKLETDFFYKVKTFLYGVRMGLGFFEGRGGNLADIENGAVADSQLEPLSFSYMFLELEFRIVKYFYISGLILTGTTLQEFGEEHEGDVIVGGQGRIRIGEDWAYLVLAGSFTKDAGVEAELSVSIDVLKKFPIAGYVLVTDLPVQEEWSVRLVGQAGWRPLPWIALSLRAGWNIRTIKHEGWSVGVATQFRW